ncbi:lipase chaperone [Marinobacter sp. JSM 1782161]|uniref:lipase chaperone n=1 Tax=Marinobacter sp. JSM 1782161 TaxID=2685906 RepID=UPI001401EC53|nr:lipase chaperone [Marinobacter sp. JSM 1782161]
MHPDRRSDQQQEQARQNRRERHRAIRLSLALALPLCLVITITLAGLAWITPAQRAHEAASVNGKPETGYRPAIVPASQNSRRTTVQGSTPASAAPVTDTEADFNLDAVANALSRLNHDDNGRLLLDRQARDILEAVFLNRDHALNEARFQDLQNLIEAGLQDEAGRQAAAVAARFYRYSNAYREIRDTLGRHAGLDRLEANYRQIHQLRRTYLGADLATALYGDAESLMRYTLASMRLQANPSLTPQQRLARQEALRSDLPASLADAMTPPTTP